jgi:hypothetical protein
LRSLNLADNNLGQIVEGLLPDGWKSKDDDDAAPWLRIEDGHEQDEHPNAKPEGITAIANAIPNMRALYSLDLSANRLGAEGAKVLAKMLKTRPLMCDDGKCFKSKGMLAQSTCKHCGHKKSAHSKGALSVVVARDNGIPPAEEELLRSACDGAEAALAL